MSSDAKLIRGISKSVSQRMTPGEFYRRGKARGAVRVQWTGKGQAERKGKRRKAA